ncbi:MAG: hypothetical protein A2284_16255 [Deltaproteobacteria bacterium RIFOXYA12_FULL_61_11]|nr:MAG: hypothetical protein A2284_16255 [Deltaproteobacteria bacterium RIFOXYA12_FULL_61_11]
MNSVRSAFLLLCATILPISALAAPYDVMVEKLAAIAKAKPALASMVSLGENDQGTQLLGLRLTDASSDLLDLERPAYLYIGTHHGNEQLTADVAFPFIDKVLSILGDPANSLHGIYARAVLYVFPVLNVTGYNRGSRAETAKNGRTYDPNRDYPDACTNNAAFNLTSTTALARFIHEHEIVGAVTGHGYIGTFTYPWGIHTKNTQTADHAFYDKVAKAAVAFNSYRTGTHTDVIYPAVGSFEDWAYHKYGVWTMLLEMSRQANLDKDAKALVAYYALLPDLRSQKHVHDPAQCRGNLSAEELAATRP